MYSKENIGKISPVVSQPGHYECTTTLGTLKEPLVNYSNCFLKIFVYCTYSKGDIGKISL